jgi:beta-N-acetylhexosaminidase
MVAGACILGCAGPRLSRDEARFLGRADPWGFILFARNLIDPAQIRRLTADLRDAVGRDAPVLIDQEGGRVARLRPPQWRAWLPPLEQMAQSGGSTRALYLRAALIAAELRALGIDTNCAPVADIAGPDTHPFLRNRCHGTDAAGVTVAARAVADGLLAGGVLPVVKHLPGHGRAEADSHHHLPRVTADIETLRQTDFAPFRALADLPLGMTAHVVFDALDPHNPATTSPEILAMIRAWIGFEGLLMTDDISMQALAGRVGARAGAALAAGCDLVLHCNGDAREAAEVAERVGPMSAGAIARAERALALRPEMAPALDCAALEAEFTGIMGGIMGGADG